MGFIKTRQPSSNIRRLYNILYGPSPPDKPEVIISLDAEKVLDWVEWDYLFYTLRRFGFGANFISWIKILYSLPMAAVRTNNNISPSFALTRGTRQGCLEDIKGITIYCLYADDMLLYLSDVSSSLPVVLNLLSQNLWI